MGGTISLPSEKQQISDLRRENEHLLRLLKDILKIKTKNKELKKLQEEINDYLYPKKKGEEEEEFKWQAKYQRFLGKWGYL